MAVLGIRSFTLEVPALEPGLKFYEDAGLVGTVEAQTARFRCVGQDRESIFLRAGALHKRLHHIALRADGLREIASKVAGAGGTMVSSPPGYPDDGLWVLDPHGVLIHLEDVPADPEISPAPIFEINAPGRLVRTCRSAMLPGASYAPVQPKRLGHVLLFTPDVARSVAFFTEALGMGLADRSQHVIAFCCAKSNSEHHVVAFALSPGAGFHHCSFQVNDPDEVGRAGRALVSKAGRGDWGFGRHTIGSNYFHYIQDPWGSWFEYYSDMDFIDDYKKWLPTDYKSEDSLANWAPAVPKDFVHNYEIENGDYRG